MSHFLVVPLFRACFSLESVSGKERLQILYSELDGLGLEGDPGQVRHLVAVDFVLLDASPDGVVEEVVLRAFVELGAEVAAALLLAEPEAGAVRVVGEEPGGGALEAEDRGDDHHVAATVVRVAVGV